MKDNGNLLGTLIGLGMLYGAYKLGKHVGQKDVITDVQNILLNVITDSKDEEKEEEA